MRASVPSPTDNVRALIGTQHGERLSTHGKPGPHLDPPLARIRALRGTPVRGGPAVDVMEWADFRAVAEPRVEPVSAD
ncbi:hypothetical protein ACWCPT_04820 [Streptomyces sp. NPDC002308]